MIKSFLKEKERERGRRVDRSCLLTLFLLLLWFLTGSVSWAQYSASIITPVDGSTGISTSPTITVLASASIDSGSVTWSGDKDDGIFTISVIPKVVFQAAGSSAWATQFEGTFSMPASNQLRFTPSSALDWNTEYIVILSGLELNVGPGPGGPVPVTGDTISFRTQEAPHHLMSSSHFYGDPLCQCDTIKLLFNRKLDSAATASGPIAVMEKVYEDSLRRWGDSVIPFDLDFGLSSDSLELYVTFDDSLELGESYRLRVLVERLSGNSIDNREYPLFAPARWPVHITPLEVGTGDSLTGFSHSVPFNREVAYGVDDSVLISAGLKSGYTFTRWIAPGLSSVDSSVSPTLTFVQPCRPIDIIAEYTPLFTDSLHVLVADSGGYTIVYSGDLDSLGGPGSYGFQEGEHFFVKAMPSVGYRFRQWNSNISAIHGRTDIAINVPGLGGGKWLEPWFEDEDEEEPEYKYCGSIEGDAEAVSHAALTASCHTTEEPESRTITCNIISPNGSGSCYRIVGRIDPDGTIHDYYSSPKTTDALTWTTDDNPVPSVMWFVEATPSYTLTVSIEDEDGNPVDGRASVLVSPNKTSYLCGETVTLTAQDDPVQGVAFKEWQPGGSTTKTLILTMDENKSITAVFEESFAVTKYHWFKGTTAQTSTYSPHETVTDVQMLTLTPKNSTYVTIEFNRPVNTSTVNSGSLWVEEAGERIDGGALHRYHTGNCAEVFWYDNNTKLKLLLYDNGANVSVLKMQSLRVHVTDAVKSATGTTLDNPHVHNAIMEKPDVRWGMEIWVTYDTDPGGSGEIYGSFNAVRYGSKGLVTPQWNSKMPGGTPQNVASPPNVLTTIASGHGFLAPSIADDEVLEMGVVVLDEDAGDVLGSIVTIAATVGGIIGALQTAGLLNPKTTVAIAGKLLSEVGKLQGTAFQDDDDNVTNANFRFGQADHWGAKAPASARAVWRDYGAVILIVTLE